MRAIKIDLRYLKHKPKHIEVIASSTLQQIIQQQTLTGEKMSIDNPR